MFVLASKKEVSHIGVNNVKITSMWKIYEWNLKKYHLYKICMLQLSVLVRLWDRYFYMRKFREVMVAYEHKIGKKQKQVLNSDLTKLNIRHWLPCLIYLSGTGNINF